MRKNDIAIIGVACLFPGSKGYEEYWENLKNGKCSISEIGKDRWDTDKFFSKDYKDKNKTYSKWCGLINDVYDFDNSAFFISRREAEKMDPQQRLLLQETWHCIEDSGVSFRRLREQTTSVFVGNMNSDYRQDLQPDDSVIDGYTTLGSFENMLANRISHCFSLNGASASVNAACASSLVAIDYAVDSLINGNSDYSIAAAANINLEPEKYISFSKARMLSPNGRCKTFDVTADGYVPGDGVAVLLLQRLELAEKQGNKIYGVIKGVSVGHNGGALTITAPKISSQVKVISEAYKKASIQPDEISYVETHGTGTSLGDPIEISALKYIFEKQSKRKNKCYIGSVKTNIGHLEAASGMAGVIKVLMMMKYHKIPATINTNGNNEIINLKETPFDLNPALIDWKSSKGVPLKAGISSFGFGGTNAHIVIEEYIDKRKVKTDKDDQIMVMSADSLEAADHIAKVWNSKVADFSSDDYPDILKTALNEDRNRNYRYAKIVHYGEKPVFGENDKFSSVKNEKKILVFDELTKEKYLLYKNIKNRYYRYNEILDELLKIAQKHKLSIDLDEDIENISDEKFKINSFIVQYGMIRLIDELGVRCKYSSWNKNGIYILLASENIYSFEDILMYLNGKKALKGKTSDRYQGILIMPDDGSRIYPFDFRNIRDNLKKFIELPLTDNDKKLLEKYKEQYYLLIDNQYTFKNNVSEWDKNLNLFDFGNDIWRQKYALIALFDSIRRLKDKWEIEITDMIDATENKYFIDLIANKILSVEEFLEMIEKGTTLDLSILEERAEKYFDENNRFNLFRQSFEFDKRLLEKNQCIEYTNKTEDTDTVYLSDFFSDLQNELVNIWLDGADISFDRLYNDSEYLKKSVKRNYFLKNVFAKPYTKDMIHVYRNDDALLNDHNILDRYLVPGAEFVCQIIKDYDLDSISNILFRKAALVDGKKEYLYKNENETYQVIDVYNNDIIFSCSHIGEKDEIVIDFNEAETEHNIDQPFYDRLKRAGYNYGESLRLVSKYSESDSYYIFSLRATERTESTELLDNAFQAAILLAGITHPEFNEITYFPYCIDRIDFYQKLYGDVKVYIPKSAYNSTDKLINTDIFIIKDNAVILKISHMIFKSSKKLESSNYTYKLQWIDTEFNERPLSGSVVILGEYNNIKAALTECCKNIDVTFADETYDINNIAEKTKLYWFCDVVKATSDEPDKYYKNNIVPFLSFAKKISETDKKVTLSLVCSGNDPYDAALKGILKALKKENSNINTGVYTIEGFDDKFIHDLIYDEPDNMHEVFIGKSYKKKELVPVSISNDNNTFIEENGVYVIIGGAGGIGREIGKLLVEKKNIKIVLTGRNKKSDYIDEIIQYVSPDKDKCAYYSADVCDKNSMQQLINNIKERFGRVDGLIHSAVDMVDVGLKNITEEMFIQGLRCKYYGAKILADICIENDIKNVLFFSSILTYTGNKGQASYIAGCNFLDEYAAYLNTKGLNAKVINWGYWSDTGIAKNAHFEDILKSLGVGKMKTSEGISQFVNAMSSDEEQIFIVKFDDNDNTESNLIVNEEIQVKKQDMSESVPTKKIGSEDIVSKIIEDIHKIVQNLTHNANVSIKAPFMEIGIESIIGVELVNEISELYNIQLSQTIIFDYPTIKKISEAIYKRYKESIELYYQKEISVGDEAESVIENAAEEPVDGTQTVSKDIAIVGISCRLGETDNTEELWNALLAGKNLVTEIPEERWKLEGFYDPDRNNKKASYCKWGSFISNAYDFEPSFFKISPKEAKYMDPQQRVLMEESYKALEDAGYTFDMLDERKCGAIYGIMNNDYREILVSKTDNVDYGMMLSGNSNAILSARISYLLNLKGPAFTLDTACSSSLVAIHLGCQAIQNGDADMMIIGGTTLYLAPEYYVQMCGLSMLSPVGKCQTFDQKADGFVPGEGVGAIILKSLDKAIEDHDHIYGIIKGSGYNQDGATNGITAPSKESQRQLEMDVYKRSGIDPATISMLEAHGTGTKLGDPIEVEALKESYGEFTDKKNYCAIGSLKTYSGHTLAAAGVSSVIKVLLCMQHKKIVPSLNFETMNEFIDLSDSPFYMPEKVKDWNVPVNEKRRAAISSFGFSGTNVHMIIEESVSSRKKNEKQKYYLLPISAKTDKSFKMNINELILWLEKYGSDEILDDLQYTLIMRRNHFKVRGAVIAENNEGAINGLKKLLEVPVGSIVNMDKECTLNENEFYEMISHSYLSESDMKKICCTGAEKFVDHEETDWTSYYRQRENICLSIPKYSFNRQTYRADFKLKNSNFDRSNKEYYDFRHEAAFLEGHRVNGEYVVPAAYIIKMAVDEYKSTINNKLVCLKNVFFEQRVLFEKSLVKVNIDNADSNKRFLLESNDQKVYSKGEYIENVDDHFQDIDISDFDDQTTWDGEKCYEILDDLGLHYEDGFRCIKNIKIDGQYLIGKLSAYENVETYIIDGALQAAAIMLKTLNVFTSSAIPISIYRTLFFRPIEKESYIKIENYVCDIDSSFDIFIMNVKGEVCVFMENVVLHSNRTDINEKKMLEMLEKLYEGSENIDDVMEII